jgi:predicted transcriptional regulator
MLKDYLSELIEKGFIAEEIDEKEQRRYYLTEKGYKYLDDFSVIKSFIESYGLD